MNKKIKFRWLKALRSGQYDQGQYRLVTYTKEGDRFCCLGVLCNLCAESKFGKENNIYFDNYGCIDKAIWGLPESVTNWANLEDDSSILGKLITMNDKGKTFEQIADVIEKEL